MKYHSSITNICYDYGKSIIGENKILNSFKENPLSVAHITDLRKDVYKYKPDAYYIRDTDKRYITFQVLDSQGKKPKEIVGDILNALLTFQIKYGYFIVKNKTDYKKVDNILKVAYSIFQNIYYIRKKNQMPDLRVALIESKSSTIEVEDILRDICKKDKWLLK